MRTLLDFLLHAINYDYFPKISLRLRNFVNSVVGFISLAALISLSCGLLIHHHGYILFTLLISILLFGIAFSRVAHKLLCGSIDINTAAIYEDSPLNLFVNLYNASYWKLRGLSVHLELYDNSRSSSFTTFIHSISRRSYLTYFARIPNLARGIYPKSTPYVSTKFPFGIWECRRELEVKRNIVVWPKVFPVGPVPYLDTTKSHNGLIVANRAGCHGEVFAIRPYRRGDLLRKVHWTQTARHDQLIVCEMHTFTRPRIHIILDTNDFVHAGLGSNSTREWAIRIAASFVKGWIEQGAEVGIQWDNHYFAPAFGNAHINSLLNSLASIPDSTRIRLSEVLSKSRQLYRHDAIHIIITTDISLADINPNQLALHKIVMFICNSFDRSICRAKLPLGFVPWLVIDEPKSIPSLLFNSWSEV
ncbi:MAG: DUF58 domain-containing protein [Candidatus Bilamarchaeaceae archaeon]